MNNLQKQLQLASYHLGLKTLNEALDNAEKIGNTKEIEKILKDIENLIDKNEKLQNEEKIWLH